MDSPRAIAAGAVIRDLAMAGRIEMDSADRASGVHYHREGRWRFQKARNVVVAGYPIETPRLLMNSATARFPDGLANSSGLVGRNLMAMPRATYSWGDNDKRLINHSLNFMTQVLQAINAREIWEQTDDTCHLNGTPQMGEDPRTSVVNADCRSWDVPNLWICDGACRTGGHIKAMAKRGGL